MKRLFSFLFLFLGVIFFLALSYQFYLRYRPNSLGFNSLPQPAHHIVMTTNNKPMRLVINSLKLDLPLFSAKLKKNNWPTNDNGVTYLENYPIPGEPGNAILYGHNWPNLLGNLS